jgi:cytochrome c-type biogenesis protein
MNSVTAGIVFIEGIISFLSPCFLPLIPIYIGYLSGEAAEERKKWNVIKNSIFFILGFTVVFILLGATASSIGHFLLVYRRTLNKILGILVVIMGLFYMDILKLNFLNMEKRLSYEGKKTGFVGSFLLGFAVGFGWTPCIGPILASVLALAASKTSITYGVYLLFIYSMGIAIPFLITAILIEGASIKIRKVLMYTRSIKIITGIIMIATGILLYTGYFERLSSLLLRW